MLPNELLFTLISYLSSPDFVQAFFGLNRRFNTIVLESARYFSFPSNIARKWLINSMPYIENVIETISLETTSVPNIFPCTYLFLNLRTIILKYSSSCTVELNVERHSAIGAIISCMNILRLCKMLPLDEANKLSLFSSNYWLTEDQQVRKIYVLFEILFTQLHIKVNDVDNPYVNSIAKLITSYQSSLEHVTLITRTSQLMFDGRCLETLFRPCQRLKKLIFLFEYTNKEINILEQLHQFQSDWWLNDRQPPVLIQRDSDGQIFIGSMPCIYPVSLKFSTDLKKWSLNKGNLDPWLVYFTKLLNSRTIPLLPNVKHLNMNLCDLDGVKARTLITWLIMSPNVKELSLRLKNNTDRMQLGNELNKLVKTYGGLRLIFDRIETVNVLPAQGECDATLKLDMFFIFSDLFPRAILPCL
ncbi:unnamed protein product [Rotaria sp. Silwood1]|nr:unnamed protein product [Rotaria sp. Silwood1]